MSAVLDEAEPYVSEALLEEYRDVGPRLLADGKIQQEQLESLVAGCRRQRSSVESSAEEERFGWFRRLAASTFGGGGRRAVLQRFCFSAKIRT